jgi:sec-independent protein translocase protein TatB
MQKYMTQIKEEVNRESRFAELQKLQEEIKSAGNAAQQSLQSTVNTIEQDMQIADTDNNIAATVDKTAESIPYAESTPNKEQL